MTDELKMDKEGTPAIVRSSEEVSERIQQLEERMDEYDIWGHFGGMGKTRCPESGPKYNISKARRDELLWLLGEDVEKV